MAWQLEHRSAGVACKWLATRPPPKGGLNPKQNKGFNSAAGERRTLTLCAWRRHGGALVAEASSDAAVRLQEFLPSDARFVARATLCAHERPVLSMAHVTVARSVAQAGRGEGVATGVLFTGTTHGELSAWSVGHLLDRSDASERALLWRRRGRHQSGVNAMAAAPVATGVLLVTGGDDQALSATELHYTEKGLELYAACHVPCAHASAIQGVALCEARGALHVASVGLDQLLRVWRLQRGGVGGTGGAATCAAGLALVDVAARRVDVSEPSCVHGYSRHVEDVNAVTSQRRCAWDVVVGGRGTQMLRVLL